MQVARKSEQFAESNLLSLTIDTNIQKIENKNYKWTENEICGR